MNLYGFVGNNSINFIDAFGLFPVKAIGKCLLKSAMHFLDEAIGEYVDRARLRGETGGILADNFSTDFSLCSAEEFNTKLIPSVKSKTILDHATSCVLGLIKGKTLDQALSGVSSQDVKKLIKTIYDLGEKTLGTSNPNLSVNLDFKIRIKCTSNVRTESTLISTITVNMPGIAQEVAQKEHISTTAGGRLVESVCRNCCFKEKENE